MLKTTLTAALSVLCLGAALGAAEVSDGVKAYKQHRFPEAEKALRAAPAGDPKRLEYLALTLVSQKKNDEAKSELAKAKDVGLADDAVKTVEAAMALENREAEKAISMADSALELNPENAQALYFRGVAKAYKKDYPKAVEDLEKAIEIDPENAYSHYYLGMAYNQVKRPDKMVEHFQSFLQLAPDSPDAAKVASMLRSFR